MRENAIKMHKKTKETDADNTAPGPDADLTENGERAYY